MIPSDKVANVTRAVSELQSSFVAETSRLRSERDGWRAQAEQELRNAEYYRGLVVRIGEMFGVSAKTQDDGVVVDGVLCAKVPSLVEGMLAFTTAIREEAQRTAPLLHKARTAPPAMTAREAARKIADWSRDQQGHYLNEHPSDHFGSGKAAAFAEMESWIRREFLLD